jgi:predicted nucleic acid-binding protein
VIVADANLFAYLLLPGDLTSSARRVLTRDPVWAAPLLWRSEIRNVLLGALRKRRLALQDAVEAVEVAAELVRGREYTVQSSDVLRLAQGSGCSAYDCEYVALAQDLGVPLVTADRELLKAFPAATRSLAEFGAG